MPLMRIANNTNKLVLPELSYTINGVLFKVHNTIGRFCNEKQYGDLIEQLLKEKGIKYQREAVIPYSFIGERKGRNKADFIIKNKMIIEIKAKRMLTREDYYQARRYSEALNLRLTILVNLRDRYIRPRRVLNPNVK